MNTVQGLQIANRSVARGAPTLIIAEVAQGHDGSLGLAHSFIDASADAGADAVKFQTHLADAESTPAEPWRVRFSPQDVTRYDYWKRLEFTPEQWAGLKQHADRRGLIFLSSPFSPEAVDLLERIGTPAWKVASGEVNNPILLQCMIDTRKPVLLSSGLSTMAELDEAVNLVRNQQASVAVFQCTSAYPCPPERIGLNLLELLRERYRCPVGLSDHSGTVYPGLAAATLGLELLEVHVTFSKQMFGPDVPASVTFTELHQLVSGIRFIESMRAHPVNKDEQAEQLSSLRTIFTKSVVLRLALPAGTLLAPEHLAFKKPGTGFPARRYGELLGRRLRRNTAAGTFLQEGDLEPGVVTRSPEQERRAS